MDSPRFVFDAFSPDFGSLIVPSIWGVVAILAALGVRFTQRIEPKIKNALILPMYFLVVLAVGSWGYRFYSIWRLKPLKIFNDRIETPYGVAKMTEIKDYFIRMDKKYQPFTSERAVDSIRFLFIIERGEKIHALSEGDYPIDSVLSKINTVYEE